MKQSIKLAKNVKHYVSIPWQKYIVRMIPKTSMSARTARAITGPISMHML